jgi:NRPS condensation-like uncharacterized protein
MSHQEKQKLEEYYFKYIQNFFPPQTSTIFHVILESLLFLDVNFNTINLLLKLGANPNAVDSTVKIRLIFWTEEEFVS